MIGVLIPTRERIRFLDVCLHSLSIQKKVSLEVIVVIDNDECTSEFISRSKYPHSFEKFIAIRSAERLYSVKAFNFALSSCESDLFIWLTNLNELTGESCLHDLVLAFEKFFPDEHGVMALNRDSGAAFGMTTKKFIEYNEGEWFHEGYKIHYPDVELTHRAILMGMYVWPESNRILHNKKAKKEVPAIDLAKRYRMNLKDKRLYGKRKKELFNLPRRKIVYPKYDFKKFEVSLGGSSDTH